jgi:hypothetical protein
MSIIEVPPRSGHALSARRRPQVVGLLERRHHLLNHLRGRYAGLHHDVVVHQDLEVLRYRLPVNEPPRLERRLVRIGFPLHDYAVIFGELRILLNVRLEDVGEGFVQSAIALDLAHEEPQERFGDRPRVAENPDRHFRV